MRWHPQPPSLTRSPHTAHAAVSPVPSFHQALPLCVGSAKLGAAGIKPEDLNFKSVTMDSGAFICIRETAAQSVAIIDTANPTNTQRMPAPVELSCVVARSLLLCRCCRRAKLECPALTRCCLLVAPRSCVHPEGKLLVLHAASAVQIYEIESKEKKADTMLPEAAVFLKWITDQTLGIVTGTAVYHWDLGADSPVKKFDRHPTLAQSQIINYKASPDGKWLLLNGIAGGAEGITGQLQLFSVERNVSQPVPAHAATFATIAADEAEMFAFADKAGTGGTVRCSPSLVALCFLQNPDLTTGSGAAVQSQQDRRGWRCNGARAGTLRVPRLGRSGCRHGLPSCDDGQHEVRRCIHAHQDGLHLRR